VESQGLDASVENSKQDILPSIEMRMPWPQSRPVKAALVNWRPGSPRELVLMLDVENQALALRARHAHCQAAPLFLVAQDEVSVINFSLQVVDLAGATKPRKA
jgi:hypothetical protein